MSKMAPISQKKRKLEDGIQGKTSRPKKRIRKQKDYHSSSDEDSQNEDGFAPVNLEGSDEEEGATVKSAKPKLKKTRKERPSNPQEPDEDGTSSAPSSDADSASDDGSENDDPSASSTRRKP
jgi:hypothetical protein